MFNVVNFICNNSTPDTIPFGVYRSSLGEDLVNKYILSSSSKDDDKASLEGYELTLEEWKYNNKDIISKFENSMVYEIIGELIITILSLGTFNILYYTAISNEKGEIGITYINYTEEARKMIITS